MIIKSYTISVDDRPSIDCYYEDAYLIINKKDDDDQISLEIDKGEVDEMIECLTSMLRDIRD